MDEVSADFTITLEKTIDKIALPTVYNPVTIPLVPDRDRNAVKGMWVPFKIEELYSAINKVKEKSATGHDEISNIFIQHLSKEVLIVLTHIYNRILETGESPPAWNT